MKLHPLRVAVALIAALTTAVSPLLVSAQTAYEFKKYMPGLVVNGTGSGQAPGSGDNTSSRSGLQLSTSAINFGDVATGTVETRQVLISNIGAGMLAFTSAPAVTGSGAFSATTGCSTSLEPLASCLATVQFSPSEQGNASGTLTFATNAPDSPHRVTLSGRGTAVRFDTYSTDGTSLISSLPAFPETTVGSTSTALSFQVRNVGNAAGTPLLTVSPSEFAVSGCGAPVEPGFTCTVNVTFTPSTTAPLAGVVQVAGATVDGSVNVDISGTGAAVSASSWSLTPSMGRENWHGMAFGGGKFLTVGDQGHVFTSTDGITWTKSATAHANLTTPRDVFYLNGRFVVLSVVGGYTRFMSSSNGVTWSGPALTTTSWPGVAYGNGRYVVVNSAGSVAYSSDGASFVAKSIGGTWHRVVFGAGRFLAVSNNPSGTLASSTDGVTWTTVPNPLISTAASGGEIAFVNNRFILVQGASVAVSSDGINWTTRTLPLNFNTNPHIAYGGGTYVILARSNKLATSNDALNWTVGTVPTAEWHGVAYGNGRFAGATYNGYSLGYSK